MLMVTLISGASHTGKTLLAARLAKKYGCLTLSIDHLKMGIIRSGLTSLTPYDDAELESFLWPIVREIVKTAVENRQELVVEGCYIPFTWRGDFTDGYLAHIRYICLAMSESYVRGHFDDIVIHASDAEQRLDDGCALETLLEENARSIAMCREHGLDAYVIDGEYSLPDWL